MTEEGIGREEGERGEGKGLGKVPECVQDRCGECSCQTVLLGNAR